MEREMGFEPTTTTLATWRSTPELLPPEPHPISKKPGCGDRSAGPKARSKSQYRCATGDCKRFSLKLGPPGSPNSEIVCVRRACTIAWKGDEKTAAMGAVGGTRPQWA